MEPVEEGLAGPPRSAVLWLTMGPRSLPVWAVPASRLTIGAPPGDPDFDPGFAVVGWLSSVWLVH